MKIIVRKSDSEIVMVADCPIGQFSEQEYDIHILPKWDWSKADTTGVDMSRPDWIKQMMWNGTTLVPKS